MVRFYLPRYEDLWFRQKLLGDAATMSYNHAWGGTIDFPESRWAAWYDKWIQSAGSSRFYRYLQNEDGVFVGEAAYHLDGETCMADIIVFSEYRGKGYGTQGLHLLCEEAKHRGIETLYDDIAADNPSIRLFLKAGFTEEYRTADSIMLKKRLTWSHIPA